MLSSEIIVVFRWGFGVENHKKFFTTKKSYVNILLVK